MSGILWVIIVGFIAESSVKLLLAVPIVEGQALASSPFNAAGVLVGPQLISRRTKRAANA